ncbi:hypothetical protein QZH56_32650 [Streptomyces olivoreticuli]|uniref:Uncharacterized protein n=1 Tax=Streptomyces blastmyceticus TaxID=68180 RepID=A0ABN0X4G3_9ACTN|nr:DUF6372 family protein [Streptomyces olivoreticuli]WKK23420.1 hypothetical protein QZH56_32650 [Streptomyces olivoreticuli]
MAIFGSLKRIPSPQIASMEQIEPCHCMCSVTHRGWHVCSEDAYPDLRLTFHLPAVGEVSFPVCGPCFDAASARWHEHSAA